MTRKDLDQKDSVTTPFLAERPSLVVPAGIVRLPNPLLPRFPNPLLLGNLTKMGNDRCLVPSLEVRVYDKRPEPKLKKQITDLKKKLRICHRHT